METLISHDQGRNLEREQAAPGFNTFLQTAEIREIIQDQDVTISGQCEILDCGFSCALMKFEFLAKRRR
jgi:hypothetical protein